MLSERDKLTQVYESQLAALKMERQNKRETLIAEKEKLLASDARNMALRLELSQLYTSNKQYEKAIAICNTGLKYGFSPSLFQTIIQTHRVFGQIDRAIEAAAEASQQHPDDLSLAFIYHLLLPDVYRTTEELNAFRHRFTQGVAALSEQVRPLLAEAGHEKELLEAVPAFSNLRLMFQGDHQLEIYRSCGQLVSAIMRYCYPQWVETRSMASLAPHDPIRVGYLSPFLINHSVAKGRLGWIEQQTKSEFRVFCYHLGKQTDEMTEKFRRAADHFYHLTGDLDSICEQILADRLHILVYLDIGLSPTISQMAALRLAPVQCTTWGYPVTSGLPTIDYYISSQLMEPENGQEHYTEKLIPLANVGNYYHKPVIPRPLLTRTRADFGLRSDAVIYLCCQAPYKYLPQHDWVFPAIARRVANTQFVFLISYEGIQEIFRQRLETAFQAVGLNYRDYCIILPRQYRTDYWNLFLVSDIFLDTLEWSGANTTIDAIACGLPLVTLPGELMRSRHSYAMLKMLGVTDTIAQDESEYIEIAVRLGQNPEWREAIAIQIKERRKNRLFHDEKCVVDLEAFYRKAVHERLLLC